MKKLIPLLTLALTLPLAPSFAQDTVTSVNAVGMVKVTVPENGALFLARYDFVTSSGSALVTELLGMDVPVGTVIHVWDRLEQTFISPAPVLSQNFLGVKAWSRTDVEVELGDSFFIANAPNGPEFEVIFSGEVPSIENVTISNPRGFMGYPFPVEINLTSTALSSALPVGSTIFQWDSVAQSYVTPGPTKSQNFLGVVAWSSDPLIKPGHGFWVSTTPDAPSPIEPKPYLWP